MKKELELEIPQSYMIEQFYKYAGKPTYCQNGNYYKGSCPICHEGKSWLSKKRCYLLLDKGYVYCHNEQRSYTYIDFLQKTSGMSFIDILSSMDSNENILSKINKEAIKQPIIVEESELPKDAINLFDKQQLDFYQNNKIIDECLTYIQKRKLDTAINKPKAYYLSLNDPIHRNRLCVAHLDENKKIIFYQTRAILKSQEKFRYLSKKNSKVSLFGIERIDTNNEYLFLMEGAFDSTFVKNGLALASLTLNEFQEEQLKKYKFYKKVWILDNQLDNKEVVKKYEMLARKDELIFIWPEQYKDIKDINELCIKENKNEVNQDFILENTYPGLKALYKIKSRS